MTDLVERLRESIIAEAHGDGRIRDGALCERLIRERHAAADEIERLRSELYSEGNAVMAEATMAAKLADARNAALERAVRVVETKGQHVINDRYSVDGAATAAAIVAAIRELKG